MSIDFKTVNISMKSNENASILNDVLSSTEHTLKYFSRDHTLWGIFVYSVQSLLSSSVLPKNIKMRVYRTINLPVVLYGCENWSLTLREEQRLRMSENRC
jgi:hypothetical protein